MRKASLNFEGLDFSFDSEDAISSFLQLSPLGEGKEKMNDDTSGLNSPEPLLETDPLSPLVDPLHTGVFHQEDLVDILASQHLGDLDYELLSPIKFLDSPISVATSKTSEIPINMESVHLTSTPEKIAESNDKLTSNSEPVYPIPKTNNNKEIVVVANEKVKDQAAIKTEVCKAMADISLLMQTPSKLATPTPSKCTFSASPAMHLSPTDLCLSSPIPSYISNLQKTNPLLFKRQLYELQSPSNLKKCAPNQEEDVQSDLPLGAIPQQSSSGIAGGTKLNPKPQGQAKRENQTCKGESTIKGPRKKKENVLTSPIPSKIVTRTSVRSKQPKTFSEKKVH